MGKNVGMNTREAETEEEEADITTTTAVPQFHSSQEVEVTLTGNNKT